MDNSLADLNNYLFEQLENITNAETDEELEKATKTAKAVSQVADRILHNGELVVRAEALRSQYGESVRFGFLEEKTDQKKGKRIS